MKKNNVFQKTAVRGLAVVLTVLFALAATGCIIIVDDNGSTSSKPSAPTGISATHLYSDAVRISWSAASGATYYTLYWADSSSGPFNIMEGASSITGTSFDAHVTPGYTYYFNVTASNSYGESSKSSTVSINLRW